jgi:MYXO-CTERM domain-containing protein
MRSTSVFVLGGLLASCSPPGESPRVGAIPRPIVAGAADAADLGIVELVAVLGNSLAKCTATLISPHVLLTAAHCIAETTGARYVLFLGPDDSTVATRDLLPVSAALFDPQYDGNPANGHDIAVVAVATPPALPIVPINRAPLTSAALGRPARYVGYGLTDGVAQSGDGVKREATASVGQIGRNLILIGANPHGTCNGDSGGPLLMDTGRGEAIVGVVSFGDDQACLTNSFFQRLDTQVAWVDEQIARFDGPAADGGAAVPDAGRPDVARAAAPPADSAAPPDVAPPAPDAGAAPVPQAMTAAPDAAADVRRAAPAVITGGCACSSGPGRGGGGPLLVLALAVLAARRRMLGRLAHQLHRPLAARAADHQ